MIRESEISDALSCRQGIRPLAPPLPSFLRISLYSGLLTLILLFAPGCSEGSGPDGPVARDGVIDLSKWDFVREGSTTLSGGWLLQWGEFVSPGNSLQSPHTARVPRSWDQLGIPGVSGRGFGTFRLVLQGLPEADTGVLISVPSMTGAYRLYCGETLIAANGDAGDSYETTSPKRIPRVAVVPPECIKETGTVLTWHVANFRHRTGGGAAELTSTMSIGSPAQIMGSLYWKHLSDLSLLAIAFIMGLYHLVFWLFRRDDIQLVLFSAVASLFCVRIIGTQSLLQQAFPSVDFYELEFMLEYLGYYLLIPVFFSYLRAWYPREFHRIVSYALWIIGAIFSATVLLGPVDFYSHYVRYYEGVSLATFVYTLSALGFAIVRRRRGAWVINAGIWIIIGTATHDILANMGLIHTETYIAQFGFLTFLLSQSSLMAALFSDAFRRAEDLSENLEKKVVSRTEELEREKDRAEAARASALSAKQETELLADLSRQANETSSLQNLCETLFDLLKKQYGIENQALFVVDNESYELIPAAARGGIGPEERQRWLNSFRINLKKDRGTITSTFNRQRTFYLPKLPRTLSGKDLQIVETLNPSTVLQVPLVLQKRTVAIMVADPVSALTPADLTFIERMCDQIAGAVRTTALLQATQEAREEAVVAKEEAEHARAESDALLDNVLPKAAARELKESGRVEPVYFDNVSVLFTDFVGFTRAAAKLSPAELIQELDGCFSQFDEVSRRNNMEKLKTIGDAYMCAGGLPVPDEGHAIDACLAALEFRRFMVQMAEVKAQLGFEFWQIRIGIHSGPVTAGVIGKNKFSYDIWGDTVNTASRMESSGSPGMVNISGETYELVKDLFECEYRGKVEAKGKGEMDMYFVHRIKPELSADAEGLLPNAMFEMARTNLDMEEINALKQELSDRLPGSENAAAAATGAISPDGSPNATENDAAGHRSENDRRQSDRRTGSERRKHAGARPLSEIDLEREGW